MARLRGKLAEVAGARLFMFAVSDLRTGGRQSNATYQYTLLSDDPQELYAWAPKLTQALMGNDVVKDVNSDQQLGGLQTNLTIDRDTAMRLGLTLSAIDNTLYDAFGQRQVSTIYNALNQYHVVMEVAPRYWQDPRTLRPDLRFDLRRQSDRRATDRHRRPAIIRPSTGPASTAATIAADSARNLATNSLGRQRPFGGLDGRRGHDLARDDGSAFGFRQIRAGPHAAQRQSSGPVRRLDDFVQSRAGPLAQRSQDGDRQRDRAHRHALDRPRRVRRHRGDLPAIAIEHAASVRRRAA